MVWRLGLWEVVNSQECSEGGSGSEAVSYLRLIDSGTTQLKAQGHSRTCAESKENEEEGGENRGRRRASLWPRI